MPPFDISVNPDQLDEPRRKRSKEQSNEREQEPTRRRKRQADGKKKDEKESSSNGLVKFLTDRRLHGIIGIILIFFAAYVLISMISFMQHGPEDQSMISNETIEQIANTANGTDANPKIKNMGGAVGAALADTFMNKWLGLGSFVIIAYMILVGLALVKIKKCNFWSLTFKSLALSIGISIVLGFFTASMVTTYPLGGHHGKFVNDYLTSHIGGFGAFIFSILVIGIICYIYLNDLIRLYKGYRKRVDAIKEKRRLEEEERQAQEDTVNEAMKEDPMSEDSSKEQEVALSDSEQVAFHSIPEEEVAENPTEPKDGQNRPLNEIEETTTDINDDEVTFEVTTNTIDQAEVIEQPPFDHRAELSRYRLPSIDLLIDRPIKSNSVDLEEQEENKERITKTLNDYQIPIQHIEATVGPTVTLYEIIPAEGVRIAKIKRLEDDIALSLAALGIRIIAPIPGKGTIGIEVPNKDPQTVSMRSIIASKKFQECKYALPMAMGATIANEVFIADLTKMPHVLVAGATGQGKSVGLNAIIASLLYKKHPSELKFVLIDPKMVEFSLYSKLERHYLAKLPDEEEAIITDPSKVVATLNSLCVEMDCRYNLLKDANVRSVSEYNAKFSTRKLNPEKGHRYLPYIVVIVDEFADLIMTAGKEVETPIARIAQKARAVGMHMILATQRPSTNVITGIIKANFPGRIAFRVSQMVDSRTILDRTGANQLIGRGDMLFSINGEMTRMQCAFIDTEEVQAICDSIDDQIGYEHAYYLPEFHPDCDTTAVGNLTDRDTLFEEAARIVVQSGVASTSSLQRRYSIGYNRAGKIMDQLEEAKIVGPAQGGKPRQVLVDSLQLELILENIIG